MTESEATKDQQSIDRPGIVRRAFALIGIEIGTWKRFEFKFGLKRRFFLLVLALMVAAVLAMAGGTFYSTRPSFCNSCHIMEPYYNAWATSNHKMVSCVDCHYPPGTAKEIVWYKFQALSQVAKYVTRTYSSKPFAEIEDASCLRSGCHSDRLLQGRVLSEGGIIFDHKPHLGQSRYGRQLRCVSCHSQMVIGNHMEVTWDTCYLCHLKEHEGKGENDPGRDCRVCHLLPDKEIRVGAAKVVHKDMAGFGPVHCTSCHREPDRGEGKVSEDRCYTCHNQPEKLARRGETDFLHDTHVTRHSVACYHCHERIEHGVTIQAEKEPDKLISECGKCHQNQHDLNGNLYAGRGARGVPEMPSLMYQAGVDCTGCHVDSKHAANGLSQETYVAGSDVSCQNCHGDDYVHMAADSQKMIDETVALLERNLKLVREGLEKSDKDEALKARIEEKLDEAGHNLDLVKSLHAVHNIYYAAETLYAADRIIAAAAKALQAPAESSKDLPIITGHYCAVLCHNQIGVKSIPVEVNFNELKVPHQRHIDEGLSCRICHDFGGHKDLGFKGLDACLKCHGEEDLK